MPTLKQSLIKIIATASIVLVASPIIFTSIVKAVQTYNINTQVVGSGTVTPGGSFVANYGDTVNFIITPDAGNFIDFVLINGSNIGHPSSFPMKITSNLSITVSFLPIPSSLTIDASAGAGGTITPNGAIVQNFQGNQTFTITPDNGFHIDNVSVDGFNLGAINTYTFTNIVKNHTINTTFVADLPITYFDVAASASAGGTVSPSGIVRVPSGGNQFFNITPDPGYKVVDVVVDGVSKGPFFVYNIFNVTTNRTISAVFAPTSYVITATAGTNGSITPAGINNVPSGQSKTFTITPDQNYAIADVMVDEISMGPLASYTFNNVNGSHTIEAIFTINSNGIFSSAGVGGVISPAGQVNVNHGANQTFTIIPDLGYSIVDVLVDGVSTGAVSTYTFTNVIGAHAINASFVANSYSITASAGLGGSISPTGTAQINYGSSQTYIITPDIGYHIQDVLVDNISQGAISGFIFPNVTSPHSIEAVFANDITFNIEALPGPNGNISPPGITAVNLGNIQMFNIIPNAGYSIQDVLVDGISVGPINKYFFTNVTASHTISASFAINSYNLTATASAGGTISPLGVTVVNYGGNQTYTIAPDVGQNILDVLVDGTSIGAVNNYTFTNVTSPHTIEAVFSIVTNGIVSSATIGGTITPTGATAVNYGASQNFVIIPDLGYHVQDVLVDGVSIGATSTYQFTNVVNTHTIDAVFAIDTFTISAIAGANGMITPSGDSIINFGNNQTYNITPNNGFQVTDVLVDGISVGVVNSYIFNNVTANHTIFASFSPLSSFTLSLNSGWNMISLPVQPIDPLTNQPINHTADSFGKLVGADVIAGWDNATQNYRSHIVNLPINDFALTNGTGFFVHLNTPTNVTITGILQNQTAQNILPGWNLLGWNGGLSTTAQDLGTSLVGADVVVKYDSTTQQWQSHIINLPINNFIINQGDGIFVHKI